MNALPMWSRRRFVVLGFVAVVVGGLIAAGVATWRSSGHDQRVVFTDVVGAVLVRGKVFHAQCSASSGGATTTTFEQWYSPDLGATRTETRLDGKPLLTGIVMVRDGVDLDVATGSLSPHETKPNASGLGLGPPELAVVHIGSLAGTKDVTFVRSAASDVKSVVEARALRIRPPSEAGEDEPVGGLQVTTWELDGRTMLPLSAHYVETRPDGSNVQAADITCTTAEMLDESAVDPAIFDIDALRKQATPP